MYPRVVPMQAPTRVDPGSSLGITVTVFLNARIWTADHRLPTADALAIRGERIIAIGSRDDVFEQFRDHDARVVDAAALFGAEALFVPGFIDSHLHLLDSGIRLLAPAKLRNVRSRDEFVAQIGAAARTLAPGEWLLGGDWDER